MPIGQVETLLNSCVLNKINRVTALKCHSLLSSFSSISYNSEVYNKSAASIFDTFKSSMMSWITCGTINSNIAVNFSSLITGFVSLR